jgi:hypothetical protein
MPCEQLFVVVGSEAERGDVEAELFRARRYADNCGEVLDADSRLAVRQQNQVRLVAWQVHRSYLLRADHQRVINVGCVADCQAHNVVFHQLLIDDFAWGHHDIDGVREGDNRQHILLGELVDDVSAGLLGVLERRAFHRAAPIQHEAEVQRRASHSGLHSADDDQQSLPRDALCQRVLASQHDLHAQRGLRRRAHQVWHRLCAAGVYDGHLHRLRALRVVQRSHLLRSIHSPTYRFDGSAKGRVFL